MTIDTTPGALAAADVASDEPMPALFTPAFVADPLPTLTRLRRDEPAHWVEDMQVWLFTRHDDVKRLFHDTDVATPDRRVWEHYAEPPEGTFERWLADNSILSLDGEQHARVRRLVSTAFTPRAIRRIDEQIEQVVAEFVEPLRGRTGVVDLMAELTDPIPNTVISRITGIPAKSGDELRFRRLAQSLIGGAIPFADDEMKVTARDALVELSEWVRTLADQRAAEPRDDLISDLVQANDMGDPTTSEEIVVLVAALIGAGSETTALAGMVATMQLLAHPDVMERMRRDRSLVPDAVNEIIRFGMSGPGVLPRYASRDFEIHGRQVRKGQMLMLSFGGANFDPDVWDRPDEFDIERDNTDMLNFGFGPHFCLGVHLARAELRCVVDGLLDILPADATIHHETMEFRPMGLFERPVTLPIDFGQGR